MLPNRQPIPTQRPTPTAPKPAPAALDTALRVATAWGTQPPAPKPAAAPSPTTPSIPPITATASSAFLTPRVVDQRVFEDFAGQLRDLANAADAKTAALNEAAAKADAATKASLESTRQHRAAVEVLGKLLHALNARTAEIDTLLRRAVEQANTVQAAETRLTEAAARITEDFERRFIARLDSLGTGASASRIAELVDDAERVKDELHSTVRRLADLNDHAKADTDAAEAHLARVESRATSLIDRTDSATKSLKSQIEAADDLGSIAFQRITEAADAAAPLESLLGACARVDESLKTNLAHADRSREASAGIAQELASLLLRADAAREEMRSWSAVLDSAARVSTLPAPLENIAREFRTSLAQDLSKMASAMSLIARRAETTIRLGESATPEIVIRAGKDLRETVE